MSHYSLILEVSLECRICTENFTSKADLLRHFDLHPGEKPFNCLICQKSVMHIEKHMRTHTGQKPCYNCDSQSSKKTIVFHNYLLKGPWTKKIKKNKKRYLRTGPL